MDKEKIIMAWSGGKDSCFALHEILREGRYEPIALLTTVTEDYGRISMHGVRKVLLEEQARAIGISLETVLIPKECANQIYEERMREALERLKSRGILKVAFGDIFLEDIRKYREANLAKAGMEGIFPLWRRNTRELAGDFIDAGFQAVIVCVDEQQMPPKFAGRLFDRQLLAELPPHVDPCAENGEFHTFVFGGPVFERGIEFALGETVLREGRFRFCDLTPLVGETIACPTA